MLHFRVRMQRRSGQTHTAQLLAQMPAARASPASAASANRKAASEVEAVAGPHRVVGLAAGGHAVPYRHSM